MELPPPPPTRSYFDALTSGNGHGVVKWGKWYPSEQHAQMLGPPSVTDALVLQDRVREMQNENDIMQLLFQSQALAEGDPEASHNREHAATCLFVTGLAQQKFKPAQIVRIARHFDAQFSSPNYTRWFA